MFEVEKKPLKVDLQFFAAEEGVEDGNQSTGDHQTTADGKSEEIELPKSQEELLKLLQSEADKRVTGALKTAQEKWEKEFKDKLEAEKAEAEKLANMTASEKEKALLEKSKKEIEDRERAIQQKELKLETINFLNEKELPIQFADILLADDAEKTKDNVDIFEKAFREAVENAVTERLKGSSPKGGKARVEESNIGKRLADLYTKKNEDLEKARKSYFG
ncbi:DUF4355 domain-containing protein [Bacillus chungangensis]|uniref:Vacuolar-type H+-ATPase subunit I/STV1 n=1 Tax=Bacillus chungangensis TaxID=587633 RepID=A0ABT9WS73_9BACI|nr:DUF4355 domain-containing protein [Bacillus chungangensis]MDQ0175998.1 vacuolar-type H+-ATPase subunit I/STV1 [Bacillus chungangensis]